MSKSNKHPLAQQATHKLVYPCACTWVGQFCQVRHCCVITSTSIIKHTQVRREMGKLPALDGAGDTDRERERERGGGGGREREREKERLRELHAHNSWHVHILFRFLHGSWHRSCFHTGSLCPISDASQALDWVIHVAIVRHVSLNRLGVTLSGCHSTVDGVNGGWSRSNSSVRKNTNPEVALL